MEYEGAWYHVMARGNRQEAQPELSDRNDYGLVKAEWLISQVCDFFGLNEEELKKSRAAEPRRLGEKVWQQWQKSIKIC